MNKNTQKKKLYKRAVKNIRSSIDVRHRLPLLVRAHYDIVKDWSRVKVFGIGMMMVLAVFGVLLATQAVSPSVAATTTLPVVSVSQNGSAITARVTNSINVARYQYAFLANSNESCIASKFFRSSRGVRSYSNGRTHNLKNNNRRGQRICFRVQNRNTGEWGYQSVIINEIDPLAPVVTVRQNTKTITARVSRRVTVANWQYVITNSDRPCSDAIFQINPNGGRTYTRLTTPGVVLRNNTHANMMICFRAQHASSQSWGYGHLIIAEVDFGIPAITVSQSNNIFVARSRPSSATNWQYVITNANRPCNGTIFQINPNGGQTYTELITPRVVLRNNSHTNMMICFRARTSSTQAWGYGKRLIATSDFGAPTITVTTSGQTIKASSKDRVDVSTWSYVVISPSQNCSSSVFRAGASVLESSHGRTYLIAGNRHSGQQLCFRVRGAFLREWGFASHTIPNTSRTDSDQSTTNINNNTTTTTTNETTSTTTTSNVGKPDATSYKDPVEELPEEVTATGILDDELNLSQLAGFILVAGSILGTARILMIKRRYGNKR